MMIYKKIFLHRYCISVITRHDLVVVVIYLSQGYATGGPWSYSKTKENTEVAHRKNIR